MKNCACEFWGAFIAVVTMFALVYFFCVATPPQFSAEHDLAEMEASK